VCLGYNGMQDRYVPTLLAGAAFDEGKMVMVAARNSQTHSLRDGEGDAVNLGQWTIRPAGARRKGAEAASGTAAEGEVWRVAGRDGVLWRRAHAGADSRGRPVELRARDAGPGAIIRMASWAQEIPGKSCSHQHG